MVILLKEVDIYPLDQETFEREITLDKLKGKLTLSNGENYTVEQQKVRIDKSKLKEESSKFSVNLKVNSSSNGNETVLYTLDSNDKTTLNAQLENKVKLDSDGKFEFSKDLEVGKTYKAKASAKGYETLEFEIIIENGTNSPTPPPQDEPQPPNAPQEVKVIFKLQAGSVSNRSEFAENKKI